jgi:cobalt-precorrin 5A hydrolase / precorrin-3B C17-methyltransferase
VLLRPASLVVGVGSSTGAESDEVVALVATTLAEAGLSADSLQSVATIDRRRHHPAITGLGLPVTAFGAETLAAVGVPNPSDAARRAVGTASVCEAAALLAAGDGATLVVEKRTSKNATVAVARRSRPLGRVVLVGLGPGGVAHRTPAAEQAVRRADVVIGYAAYVDQCQDLLVSHHRVIRSQLGSELERAREALTLASQGKSVAMVCSGDPGVYAMASPVLELTDDPAFASIVVDVVPGVTAGLATSALLGAPLGHDHVLISLSDLLTPWDRIEARLRAAAESDLVVVLYNPRSERRTWQLGKALGILAGARPLTTPVGIVTDAGREEQQVMITSLEELDPATVTMTTCVIVGSSTTFMLNDRMVTPRGYPR